MPAINHYFLHLIKKLFTHDWRMSPFVYLATVFEVAVVENVREYESNLFIVHSFTTSASDAIVVKKLPNVFISRTVLGVELKGSADHFGLLPVQRDGLGTLVI